jgi:hypothetical protein
MGSEPKVTKKIKAQCSKKKNTYTKTPLTFTGVTQISTSDPDSRQIMTNNI